MAVDSIASDQGWSKVEETRVYAKISRRIVPLILIAFASPALKRMPMLLAAGTNAFIVSSSWANGARSLVPVTFLPGALEIANDLRSQRVGEP